MRRALLSLLALVLVAGALFWFRNPRHATERPTARTPIVINEAVRTVLYLPVYHALERGYFSDENLDAQIVTGGTATNSFAAMMSGEAQFSIADPMYVPIALQQGGQAKVIGQVVGRIAVWGIASSKTTGGWTTENVKGKRVSTQQKPMTAYVYAIQAIKDLGLDPEKDVTLIEGRPGSEIAPLASGDADFVFTLEPGASTAVSQGGRIVVSFPERLGDRVFTGMMVTQSYLASHPEAVRGAATAIQRALDDLAADATTSAATATKYFPQVQADVVQAAVAHLIRDGVIPRKIEIPEESWNAAIAARLESGDLKNAVSRDEACSVEIMHSVSGGTDGGK
jgi:NitT/TauT family transport system substrate-binding protein